jgi:hypothetical protein
MLASFIKWLPIICKFKAGLFRVVHPTIYSYLLPHRSQIQFRLLTGIPNHVQTLLDEWIAHRAAEGGNNANAKVKSIY